MKLMLYLDPCDAALANTKTISNITLSCALGISDLILGLSNIKKTVGLGAAGAPV